MGAFVSSWLISSSHNRQPWRCVWLCIAVALLYNGWSDIPSPAITSLVYRFRANKSFCKSDNNVINLINKYLQYNLIQYYPTKIDTSNDPSRARSSTFIPARTPGKRKGVKPRNLFGKRVRFHPIPGPILVRFSLKMRSEFGDTRSDFTIGNTGFTSLGMVYM